MKTQIKIPHQKREIFNKTFLYNVVITCAYEDKNLNEYFSEIKSALVPLGWMIDEKKCDSMCFRKSGSVLTFANDNFMLSMPRSDYQNFDNISDIIDKLEYIHDLAEIKIVKLLLAKNNRFNIKHTNNKGDEWMRHVLFSTSFLDVWDKKEHSYFYQNNQILTAVLTRNISKDDIDTVELSLLTVQTENDNFKDGIIRLNDEVYDVWYWAMSDDMLQMMKTNK